MFDKTSDLKAYLDSNLGDGWVELEPETVVSEILAKTGIEYTGALTDKVELIRCLEINPNVLFEDALFFLHAVDVLNGELASFSSYIPMPTSLELAWGIEELKTIFGEAKKILPMASTIRHVVEYILRQEGYRSPTKYFKDYVDPNAFADYKEEPTKEKAIGMYIEGRRNGMDG